LLGLRSQNRNWLMEKQVMVLEKFLGVLEKSNSSGQTFPFG
jgi:hypothetical protein